MTGKPVSESCDTLIRNGYLLTMDAERTVYSCGAVAINDKTIIAVGRDAELSTRFRPRRLFDAKGAVIHPGFIDCHYHANIHLIRGIAPDDPKTTEPLAFSEWTNQLEAEDEYIQTQVVGLEMLRHGYTFFLEPGTVYEPDAAAAAVESVGVRAGLADPYLWDVSDAGNSRPSKTARIPNDSERAFKVLGGQLARNKDPYGLVRGHVAIYGEGSQSEPLMRAAKECADAAGVTFTMHHNFTPEQAERDDARLSGGSSSMVYFAQRGLLGPNCLFVHMNVIRDDEIPVILDSAMSLVWHPGNAMYYGINSDKKSRIPELIDRGCNVVFGVDVAKVWTFGGLEYIGYLAARQDKHYIPSTRLLEMRTTHAARALGLSEMIGSIEVGKRADIAIRSNREPETLPGINPVQELLLTGHSTLASTVFVNGKLVLLNGQSTQLDQEAVLASARAMARRVLSRAGYVPRVSWPVIN
ncbi:amidohydrolase family protein [Mesorhizobium sp.]|uniref:amidohydrolase family protein n=1 Tax=Mesorhizobium sp. TaxID=1871066 RepID=UPI000FE33857|nr:amidohydrolase family protein [Mesorhizobium sp.]RWN94617.1 MAG: hypothetical protein EOS06_30025 [Mesorhizobium sp.]RWO75382.1 MAG: hypothetical protein EOS18_30720 [Mesorhizobium sp.]TJU74339.1 MAG: hypothetical protein E5Y15_31515 [Mesorhizobium sp.]